MEVFRRLASVDFDYGWLGSKQRQTEHKGSINTIEMGQRQYVPGLGRFIEIDPVEGGSANDYDYVSGDPVGGLDLDGRAPDYNKGNTTIAWTFYFENSWIHDPVALRAAWKEA